MRIALVERHSVTNIYEYLALFAHIRKAMERDSDRILGDTHPYQFFYLGAFFLEAQRIRTQGDLKRSHFTSSSVFGLVAAVLNQETFIMLNKFIVSSLDLKVQASNHLYCKSS